MVEGWTLGTRGAGDRGGGEDGPGLGSDGLWHPGQAPCLSGLGLPGLSRTWSGRRSHMVTKNKGNGVDRTPLNLSPLLSLCALTHSRPKWAGVFCVCLHLPPSSLMLQLGVCCLWAPWPANSSEGPRPHDIRDSAWFLGVLKGFPTFLPAVAIWVHTCPHPLPRAALLLVAPLTGVMGQEAGTPRGGGTGC